MIKHRDLYRLFLNQYGKGTTRQIYKYALKNGAVFKGPDEKYQLWSVRRSLDLMVQSGEILKEGSIYYLK